MAALEATSQTVIATECAICLFCEVDDSVPLLRRDFPHHVVCRRCGLVYQNPRPSQQDMEAYYSQGYWEGRQHWSDGDATKSARRAQTILELVRDDVQPEDLIIEVGCGTGEILAALRNHLGCAALGIEPSEMQAADARQRYDLEVICGALDSTDIGPRRCKLLILSHVLEHFHDPRAALRHCRDMVDAGGIVYIEVPNILRPPPKRRFSTWIAIEHLYYFSLQTLTRLVGECGFRACYTEREGDVVRLMAKPDVFYESDHWWNEYWRVWIAKQRHAFQFWPWYTLRRMRAKLGLARSHND